MGENIMLVNFVFVAMIRIMHLSGCRCFGGFQIASFLTCVLWQRDACYDISFILVSGCLWSNG